MESNSNEIVVLRRGAKPRGTSSFNDPFTRHTPWSGSVETAVAALKKQCPPGVAVPTRGAAKRLLESADTGGLDLSIPNVMTLIRILRIAAYHKGMASADSVLYNLQTHGFPSSVLYKYTNEDLLEHLGKIEASHGKEVYVPESFYPLQKHRAPSLPSLRPALDKYLVGKTLAPRMLGPEIHVTTFNRGFSGILLPRLRKSVSLVESSAGLEGLKDAETAEPDIIAVYSALPERPGK